MRILGIASGLMAILAVGSAHATVVVSDTILGQTTVNGLTPNTTSGHGPIGDSFTAASTETITSSVTLARKWNWNQPEELGPEESWFTSMRS